MSKLRILTGASILALTGAFAFSATPAKAQSATLGYQCFATVSQVQYCSCTAFSDLDSASAWIASTLVALGSSGLSGDDTVMASHSDQFTQTQATPCT